MENNNSPSQDTTNSLLTSLLSDNSPPDLLNINDKIFEPSTTIEPLNTTDQKLQDNMDDSSKKILYVPENFRSIISDFANDLTSTFPEYSFLWEKWGSNNILKDQELIDLFEYVLKIFPERFFDILYQNDDIFDINSNVNTMFLPNVEFKVIFQCEGISENTKKVIWRYLQLLLFSILSSINDKKKFGETINIFEGLDESILQEKLEETIKGMNDFFTKNGKIDNENTDETTKEDNDESTEEDNDETTEEDNESPKMSFDFENNIPNPEELHEHLKTLFDGKIGKLAKELAEEISEDINQFIDKDDLENVKTSQDVIKTLLKNPKKMMDLVKNVGKKLNNKMESGEISQEEIMKEAGDLFSKMKDMKGTKQFNEMFKNMAKQMGMTGNGMKPDTNAMDQKMKNMQLKEKLRKRLQNKKDVSTPKDDDQNTFLNLNNNPFQEIENIMKTFGLSDTFEKPASGEPSNKNNKKKNKKR